MVKENGLYRYVFTLFSELTPEYLMKHKVNQVGRFSADQLEDMLHVICKQYSFQEENTQGLRLHWQGRLSLVKKRTKKQLLQYFKEQLYDNWYGHGSSHWQTLLTIQPEQDAEASKRYVKKNSSRVPGSYRSLPKIYMGQDLDCMTSDNPFYEWQNELNYVLFRNSTNDRQITVIADPRGNSGKTKWIKRHLFFNDKSQYISVENNIQQTLAALSGAEPKQTYLFDVPRGTRSDESWHNLFRLCENLKNGLISSTFYGKYTHTMFDTANVVVMCNLDFSSMSTQPMLRQLSKDRWSIYTIDYTSAPGQPSKSYLRKVDI